MASNRMIDEQNKISQDGPVIYSTTEYTVLNNHAGNNGQET